MQLTTLDPHDLDAFEAAPLAALAVRLAHPIPQARTGARVAVDCCPSRVLAAHPAAVMAALAVSVATGEPVRLALDTLDPIERRTGTDHLADRAPLAVIGCGARKLERAAPAADLYTGGYFRAALATAHHLAGPRVLILSARYGLLDPAQVVEPYELRITDPGAVTVDELRHQAHALDVHAARAVTVLAGRDYWHAARAVWPVAVWALEGLPGIGAHLARLAELRRPEPLTLFEPTP